MVNISIAPGMIRAEVNTVEQALNYIFSSEAACTENEWALLTNALKTLGAVKFRATYEPLWRHTHGSQQDFETVIAAIQNYSKQREAMSAKAAPIKPSNWTRAQVKLPCGHMTHRRNLTIEGVVCPYGDGKFSMEQVNK